MLALVLAVGLVAHGVGVVSAGSETTMTAAADMPDMPTPNKCDGCAGDEKAMMPAACAAFCNNLIALSSEVVVFDTALIGTLWPSAEIVATGHTFPPDPHPPKPIVLS